MSELQLGKFQSAHGIAPAYLQRAVIVAVLSFTFFLAMLFAFYLRQNIGYFLLSTAFLLVYLLTMFGWLLMRKNIVKIYENGFAYRKTSALWREIERVAPKGRKNFEIVKTSGEQIVLSDAIEDVGQIVKRIEREIAGRGKIV